MAASDIARERFGADAVSHQVATVYDAVLEQLDRD
jgi:hypothetical protein